MNRRVRIGSRFVPTESVNRRIARAVWWEQRGRLGRRVGLLIRFRLGRSWGVFVHPSSKVGRVHFAHPTSVVIGAGVVIEDDVMIWQNVTLGAIDVGSAGYPVVRSGAKLFASSTALGPIEIGAGAVVGAHSLVLNDVPPGATAVGQPARIIRSSTCADAGSTHDGADQTPPA